MHTVVRGGQLLETPGKFVTRSPTSRLMMQGQLAPPAIALRLSSQWLLLQKRVYGSLFSLSFGSLASSSSGEGNAEQLLQNCRLDVQKI